MPGDSEACGPLVLTVEVRVLARVGGTWIAIGMIIAVGLGIMLAVTAGKPEVTRE